MADPVRTTRWDPGARYRASLLAPAARRGADEAIPARATGRLHRGPARRTAVFDRDVWRADLGDGGPVVALGAAVAAYRRGAVGTSGLLRAVGRALG